MIIANNKSVSDIKSGDKECFIAAKGNDLIFENDCNVFEITLREGKGIEDLYRAVLNPTEENPYGWRRDKWFYSKLPEVGKYRLYTPPGTFLLYSLLFVDAIRDFTIVRLSSKMGSVGDLSPEECLTGICSFSEIESFNSNIELEGYTTAESLCTACESLKTFYFNGNGQNSITNFASLVAGCKNLESISLLGFSECENVNISNMFTDCAKLSSIDLTCFKSIGSANGAISGCSSLVSLKLPTISPNNLQSFAGCNALKNISCSLLDKGYGGLNFNFADAPLSRASAMIFIDYATRNPIPNSGSSWGNITFSKTTQSYLGADDIKKATDANWKVLFSDPSSYTPSSYSDFKKIMTDSEIK